MGTQKEVRIRARAYELWEEQGRPEGRHQEHWEQARREIEDAPDGRPDEVMGRPDEDAATPELDEHNPVPAAPQVVGQHEAYPPHEPGRPEQPPGTPPEAPPETPQTPPERPPGQPGESPAPVPPIEVPPQEDTPGQEPPLEEPPPGERPMELPDETPGGAGGPPPSLRADETLEEDRTEAELGGLSPAGGKAETKSGRGRRRASAASVKERETEGGKASPTRRRTPRR